MDIRGGEVYVRVHFFDDDLVRFCRVFAQYLLGALDERVLMPFLRQSSVSVDVSEAMETTLPLRAANLIVLGSMFLHRMISFLSAIGFAYSCLTALLM